MADISIINKDNTDYNVKDAAGRLALAAVANAGAKNSFNISSPDAIDYKVTHNISGDTVTITGSAGFSRYVVPVSLKAGSYIFTAYVNSISTSGRVRFNTAFDGTGTNVTSQIDFSQAGSISIEFNIAQDTSFFVMIYSSTSYADKSSSLVISQCMIRHAEITDPTFQPYGKTNAELTSGISTLFTENTSQQAEINYAVNAGAKNLLNVTASSGVLNTATIDIADDGSIHISGQPTSNGAYVISSGIDLVIPENAYILSIGAEAGDTKMRLSLRRKGTTQYVDLYHAESCIIPSGTYDSARIYLYSDTDYDTVVYPMIRRAEITDNTFVPYAPTNRELYEAKTEQTETNAIANLGAKNLLKITASSQTIKGVTFTVNGDQTVTVNGTNDGTGASTFMIVPNAQAITIPDGNYILSGCPTSGGGDVSTAPFDLRWYLYSPGKSAYETGNGAFIEKSGNTTSSNIAIVVKTGQTANNLVFKPMLRTSSITDDTFVPYAPTNRELYDEKIGIEDLFGPGTEIAANTNFNDLKSHGLYYSTSAQNIASFTNCPVSAQFTLSVKFGSQSVFQEIQPMSKAEIMYRYVRMLTNGTWSSWYKFEGTPVTTTQSVQSLRATTPLENEIEEEVTEDEER